MLLEALIETCLKALKASQQEGELTGENTSLSIVGSDAPFTIVEGEQLAPYLEVRYTAMLN